MLDARLVLVLVKTNVLTVSKIITMVVPNVMLVILVCMHLLCQLPSLNVSVVSMTTVKLAVVVTLLENVPLV